MTNKIAREYLAWADDYPSARRDIPEVKTAIYTLRNTRSPRLQTIITKLRKTL